MLTNNIFNRIIESDAITFDKPNKNILFSSLSSREYGKYHKLNETEAKAKLNLIYIKMNQSEIKSFVDEYTNWLMTEKKMNYKSILQTPDRQLHDIFETEFKK